MTPILFKLNAELFRACGIMALILFLLETLKDGYVSFYFNPVIMLVFFLASGAVWLFDWSEDK